MKKITVLASFLVTIMMSAQITFEKAYFINKSGKRVECFIKDYDWRSNPTSFEYKLSENDPVKYGKISDVSMFEIYNKAKFVSEKVQIDQSSSNLNSLSPQREPIYIEEELFLKEIVDGKADLYQYVDGTLERYFYRLDDNKPVQLIHKAFDYANDQVGYNNDYKIQLKKDLNCASISSSNIENAKYRLFDLKRIFTNYNTCINPNFKQEIKEQTKFDFNLSIRPRINSASMKLSNAFDSESYSLGNAMSISGGVEFEFIMPFNRGKWALTLEPNYQQYKGNATLTVPYQENRTKHTKADFKSIEIPIGVRHYIFLNSDSKLFLNVNYSFNIPMDSKANYGRDGQHYYDIKLEVNPAFGFGAGYTFKNKYTAEARYSTKKIKTDTNSWTGTYDLFSIILGYNIF